LNDRRVGTLGPDLTVPVGGYWKLPRVRYNAFPEE
jgi:hypothetical protein